MLRLLQPTHNTCNMDVPCFAMELEQDIARLEAEADGDDELVTFSLLDKPMDLGGAARRDLGQSRMLDDVLGMQDQDASDADTDDGGVEEEAAEVARIRANALMVSQCGKTLQPGAWRGCAKSAWCDREDRHRGLCNHRATIAGPTAIPRTGSASSELEEDSEDEEQEGQGTSQMDAGGYKAAAYADVVMHPADEEQQMSGNCQAHDASAHGDEAASALQPVSIVDFAVGVQHQHSTTQTQLQQQVAAAAAADPVLHSISSTVVELSQDLFWCANTGQLAAAELFSIPAAYQPRVKDLTAPGAACLLAMDGVCDVSTPLAASAPEDVHEVPAVAFEPTCSEDSDHTNAKACNAVNSGGSSTPSSPSCASASAAAADLAAAFAPFKPRAMAPTPMGAEAAHSPADTQECPAAEQDAPSSLCAPASPAGVAPEDEEAADTAAVVAAAAAAAQACAEAEAAVAAAPVAAAVAVDSAQAAYEQATAEAVAAAAAAEAVAEAAAAAAAALAASELSTAATVGVSASAAAAAAAPGPAGVQRPPRIKSKPSNSLMKAAAVMEASSSPKSKKRPAARMAANPGGAHSCTSCGAVSTPVWRAGPAGPKTLCNACGVRYMKVAKRK